MNPFACNCLKLKLTQYIDLNDFVIIRALALLSACMIDFIFQTNGIDKELYNSWLRVI